MKHSLPKLMERIAQLADGLHRLDDFSAEEVAQVLLGMLDVNDPRFADATLLLRDLVLIAPDAPSICERFRAYFQADQRRQFLDKLEFALVSANRTVRHTACYTLGKIGAAESLPKLWEAYRSAIVHDPVQISNLLFEIAWLSEDKHGLDEAIRGLVAADDFVLRWIAVDVIETHSMSESPDEHEVYSELWNSLKNDPHPCVRNATADGKKFGNVANAWLSELYQARDKPTPPKDSFAELRSFIERHMDATG